MIYWKLRNMSEEEEMAYFTVISWHWLERTDETFEKLPDSQIQL
jgi:hypothetical protein